MSPAVRTVVPKGSVRRAGRPPLRADMVEFRADGLVAEYHSLAPCGVTGFVCSIRRENESRILTVDGFDTEAECETWCRAELRRRA